MGFVQPNRFSLCLAAFFLLFLGNVRPLIDLVLQAVETVFTVVPFVGYHLFDITVRLDVVQMRLRGNDRVFDRRRIALIAVVDFGRDNHFRLQVGRVDADRFAFSQVVFLRDGQHQFEGRS